MLCYAEVFLRLSGLRKEINVSVIKEVGGMEWKRVKRGKGNKQPQQGWSIKVIESNPAFSDKVTESSNAFQ